MSPYAPAYPCSHPGCPHVRPCAVHTEPRPFASARRSPNFYRTRGWKRARAEHLASFPLCAAHLGRGVRARAATVDHDPPHRGDAAAFWDRRRFVSLCASCHASKTGREAQTRRQSVRA
jgi:5-methylcytosine-specific restriction enzyme A